MRVAVAYEPNTPLVIEDVAVPDVGPRDVLVRLAASGICHTDLNVLAGLSAMPFPIVTGHEGCGTAEAVGLGGAPDPRRGPGACRRCRPPAAVAGGA